MIKSITVTNPKNESLVLELANPEPSGLYIKSVDGLGPAKANVSLADVTTGDGSKVSSVRVSQRNVVLTLGMLFAPTIEAARLKTYKYFPVKKKVKLLVRTDNRTAELTGIVEANEPDIFSKNESTQISIICDDPYFYAPSLEETVFSGVRGLFEFPFSNESVTEPLIEFGEIRLDTRAILTYNGDTDTGILITIHAFGPVKDITLYNTETYERMKIKTDRISDITGEGIKYGDDIVISTIRGSRHVELIRDGFSTNIISAVEKNADWFQLTSGDNIFMFVAEEGERNLLVSFVYRNAYGGV